MWNWIKSFFGISLNKDPLRFLKKAIRVTVGLVLLNNPQFSIPLSAAIAGIEMLVRTKQPADLINEAIIKGLDDLAVRASSNPIIQAEIRDLKNDIIIEIKDLPESEKLAKIQEILDAFKVGIEAAKVK